MSRAIDRLSILGLVLIILLLLLKLFEDKPQIETSLSPKERDLFNYAGYPARKAEFQQDIDRENRLERKAK